MATASDISADGSVVVGHSAPSVASGNALRWDNGAMTSLGVFGFTEGRGVSGDGAMIVGDTSGMGFRWNGAAMTNLGTLNYDYSHPASASGDGSVIVGFLSDQNLSKPQQAFRWDDGTMTRLFPSAGPTETSYALDVSFDGSVIVGNASDLGAWRWESGLATSLDPGSGWTYAYASAISSDGTKIVGQRRAGALGEACLWDNGVATGLGSPAGFDAAYATGVSADGSVVIGNSIEDFFAFDETTPWLWTEEDGLRFLEDVLADDYGLDLTGWTLTQVRGISDDGQTLVGNGLGPHGAEAWIAHIPEPTSLSLLAIGAFSFLRRRRP
jgi:probable HAF family extracellular repeat protein